jgi:archaeosine synthase alpha-subunit
MDERPLARSVVARHRFGRLFSLGDRNSPASWSPALILSSDDENLSFSLAPFEFSRDSSSLPAKLSIKTRTNLTLPFDSIDLWEATEGLVLPPSLVESNSGEFAVGGEILPISWQSLHHDLSLNNKDLVPSIIILTDAPQLANQKGLLSEALFILRTRFPSSLIWTPGIGGPDNCAILTWMGVDLFDLARSRHASSLGVILSENGPREVEESIDEDSSMSSQIIAWKNSLAATRSAIRQGNLRELVEKQAISSPRSVERLRIHDARMSNLDGSISGLSRVKGQFHELRCHSYSSRDDPLIQDWRQRVSLDHTPPEHQSKVLVLLPCSATKPYRLSASHKRFSRSITSNAVHEVIVTAPLGLVPRELEDIWPAGNYDIPVTGDWDPDELIVIRKMISEYTSRNNYLRIINHSGIEITSESLEIIDTRNGLTAGSPEALENLNQIIEQSVEEFNLVNVKESKHRLGKLRALSRFQHGTDKWLHGTGIQGRPPIFTIRKDGNQLALWNPRLGRFSFTKACLPLLEESGKFPEAHLMPGFDWRGDLFSSNVIDFKGSIRIGDEILVYQDNLLIGSARAEAAGWEWPDGPSRLARAQHRL